MIYNKNNHKIYKFYNLYILYILTKKNNKKNDIYSFPKFNTFCLVGTNR